MAETAIQDACEALENDDDIGRMLDLLSQLHDDLVPRVCTGCVCVYLCIYPYKWVLKLLVFISFQEDLPAAEQADEVDENVWL